MWSFECLKELQMFVEMGWKCLILGWSKFCKTCRSLKDFCEVHIVGLGGGWRGGKELCVDFRKVWNFILHQSFKCSGPVRWPCPGYCFCSASRGLPFEANEPRACGRARTQLPPPGTEENLCGWRLHTHCRKFLCSQLFKSIFRTFCPSVQVALLFSGYLVKSKIQCWTLGGVLVFKVVTWRSIPGPQTGIP